MTPQSRPGESTDREDLKKDLLNLGRRALCAVVEHLREDKTMGTAQRKKIIEQLRTSATSYGLTVEDIGTTNEELLILENGPPV